jgi:hypothetical protein
MSAFIKAPFGELAPYLADYGHHPVPIRPGGKAPMLDGWQDGHPVEHWLPHRDPVRGKVTDCATWGTGILSASCPSVDLDIRDRELVRALIALADEMIGPAPFRVGSPPKALLPFATSEPYDKVSGRWFGLPGDDWRDAGYTPHRVEVLAAGQQYCAYCRHPRGTFYRWRRGEPMQGHRVDLPELTEALARAYVAAAETVALEVGAVPLRRQEGRWRLDSPQPERVASTPAYSEAGRVDRSWQSWTAETLAKRLDPGKASRTKDGWICKCPAHRGIGHRSLSIAESGGRLLVFCFGECSFSEIARAIADTIGRAAA